MAPSGADRVAVVGGGLAGLSAAYFLGRHGVPVDLFEAGDELGGLAASFDCDGLRLERYYHFICRTDRQLLDLAAELSLAPVWRKTRTTFYSAGRLYPFTSALHLLRFRPIPVGSRVRMGLEVLRWGRRTDWRDLDRMPAADWLVERLGPDAYREIWEPLLTMKFGERHREVSAAWIWDRIHRVANSRTWSLGPQVMGYFPGGTESVIRGLASRIQAGGGSITVSAPVERVLVDGGRARGVRVLGRDREYSAVVLAAPLPAVVPLLPDAPADYRARLAGIEYLGVACAVVRLDRGISGSFWCNIRDPRLSLCGMIEMSELNPDAGRGGGLIYVPFYLSRQSPVARMSDVEVERMVRDELAVVAGRRLSISGVRIFRSPFAQPVCTTGFAARVPPHRTPIAGLYLIDATQMYPRDRTLSDTIALARVAVGQLLDDRRAGGPAGLPGG